MRLQDKNTILQNWRAFIEAGDTGLREEQNDILNAAEKFLGMPDGAEFKQKNYSSEDIRDTKKGDFFEAVSATGSGKTRAFGTMAKAANVPTLILTPRNLLNKDTKKEFCEDIGIPEDDIAVYDSKQPASERRRVLEGNPPPKYVITTYQSLPSLIKRHELDVTNPDDPHYRPLIILDEVHEAQGEETAKILNDLKKEVLVAGFTATDAGAAHTLFEGQDPIFSLPLRDAIKRGILCNKVRTGVVDVDIKGESWLEDFKSSPKNKDFKKATLTHFARNESVTQGVIKFHLNEVDSELGPLWRLPTVAYIESVKAAREAADEYNEEAKRLGKTSRAAYVSGEMGEKEYGPILDAFKRGEIQFIFNDSLLGMGFDARNATVCHSLKPSNLPHIAEQQLGRVVRKQGDDYLDMYGMNKCALAINWRPKGTNPYLYAQVLGSPELTSDSYISNSWGWGGGDADRPYLPEGLEVHLDYTALRTIAAQADQDREEQYRRAPAKGDWISVTDATFLYVGNSGKFHKVFEAFKEEKIHELSEQFSLAEAEAIVEHDWIGIRHPTSGVESICASPQAVRDLKAKGKLRSLDTKVLPKVEGWLSCYDLVNQYLGGFETHYARLQAYSEQKTKELLAEGKSVDEVAAIIENDYVGLRASGSRESLCISPLGITELKEKGELNNREKEAPLKGPNWLSSNDAADKYIGSSKDFVAKFAIYAEEKKQELIDKGHTASEAANIVARDYVGLRKSHTKQVICIGPLGIAELEGRALLKSKDTRAPIKEADWLSPKAIASQYIGDEGKHAERIRIYIEEKTKEFVTQGRTIEDAASMVSKDYAGFRSSGSQLPLCIGPLGIAELEAKKILVDKSKKAPLKGDWSSCLDLDKLFGGGSTKYNKLLQEFIKVKSQQLIDQGKTPVEAALLIDTDFVGVRTSGARQGLCASPEAITELEAQGKLKKKADVSSDSAGQSNPLSEPPSTTVEVKTVGHQGKGLFAQYLDDKIEQINNPEERNNEGFLARLHKRKAGRDISLEQIRDWRDGNAVPTSEEVNNFADALNLPVSERVKVFKAVAATSR